MTTLLESSKNAILLPYYLSSSKTAVLTLDIPRKQDASAARQDVESEVGIPSLEEVGCGASQYAKHMLRAVERTSWLWVPFTLSPK